MAVRDRLLAAELAELVVMVVAESLLMMQRCPTQQHRQVMLTEAHRECHDVGVPLSMHDRVALYGVYIVTMCLANVGRLLVLSVQPQECAAKYVHFLLGTHSLALSVSFCCCQSAIE